MVKGTLRVKETEKKRIRRLLLCDLKNLYAKINKQHYANENAIKIIVNNLRKARKINKILIAR